MLKSDVDPRGIRPELILAVLVAIEVYRKHNADLMITSICEGVHSVTSLHYAGCAIDLRTRELGPRTIEAIVNDLKRGLTRDFDVIQEHTHIHVEYDPKRRD